MKHSLAVLFLLPAVALIAGSCTPDSDVPLDFRSEVQSIYQNFLEERAQADPDNPSAADWNYSYNPMIYAAWVYKGRLDIDPELIVRLQEGHSVFWKLNDDITAQAGEGAVELDIGRFLSNIEDGTISAETANYIGGGATPLNAFTMAFMDSQTDALQDETDLPEMILRMLGRTFTERPDLGDYPLEVKPGDDGTRWRDWLQFSLAACGNSGAKAIIDWDKQLEGLQDLVPDQDFWDGRLTHAYCLRTIQLAREEALDLILEELAPYHEGGEISGFHAWMYWNLTNTVFSGGGMFPYDAEGMARIKILLINGIWEGPMGDGEEARTIADALGRSPSVIFADDLLDPTRLETAQCERKQIVYSALGWMLSNSQESWLTAEEDKFRLQAAAVDMIETGGLDCGNVPLLDFYSGVMDMFPYYYGWSKEPELTDDQMVRIHEAFFDLLPKLITADERERALDLMLRSMPQPVFMENHPGLGKYEDIIKNTHDDWAETTSFEGSATTEDDFARLLRLVMNMVSGE